MVHYTVIYKSSVSKSASCDILVSFETKCAVAVCGLMKMRGPYEDA
jgi:hypothetical protein